MSAPQPAASEEEGAEPAAAEEGEAHEPTLAEEAPALVAPDAPPQRSLGHAYAYLILLGWLGAHRFYLRRNYSAGLFAMTGGFLLFGLVIDLLLLPRLVREENEQLAKEFAANPLAFAQPVHEPPKWVEEESALLSYLQFPFLLAFWILAPPTLAGLCMLYGHPEAAILVLSIVALTACMQAARRLVDREPGILKLLVIGPALKSLGELEDFYTEHRPRPVLVYLLYPLLVPFLLLFSSSARKEAAMFWRPAGLILAVLVAETAATYSATYPPHLTPADAALHTALNVFFVGGLIVTFLLPTVATSVTLNLAGHTRQARFLAAVSIPLTLLSIAVSHEVTKDQTSLPKGLLLADRLAKPKFCEEVRERAAMFLAHEVKGLASGSPGLTRDAPRTKTLRQVLTGVVPAPEQTSFAVWRLEREAQAPALLLVYDAPSETGVEHLLLVATPERCYSEWTALPPELARALSGRSEWALVSEGRLLSGWSAYWKKKSP